MKEDVIIQNLRPTDKYYLQKVVSPSWLIKQTHRLSQDKIAFSLTHKAAFIITCDCDKSSNHYLPP